MKDVLIQLVLAHLTTNLHVASEVDAQDTSAISKVTPSFADASKTTRGDRRDTRRQSLGGGFLAESFGSTSDPPPARQLHYRRRRTRFDPHRRMDSALTS